MEAEIRLADGSRGRAIAPAGASTGSGEALDLRDGGTALGGRDVQSALTNIRREIAPALEGSDATDQAAVDPHPCSSHGGRYRIRGHEHGAKGKAAQHEVPIPGHRINGL